MRKKIVVKTDDPVRKKFNLMVTGPVEKVVDINPSSVYLSGKPGETLSAEVHVTPSEKYPFSILEMKQKVNNGILASLVKPENNGTAWQVKIETTSDKKSDFYDVVSLTTDSQYRPRLTIRVYASFL